MILTAQGNDGHLDALSTIRTGAASVVLLDVFGLDFGSLLSSPEPLAHGGELDTSLLLYLAPELVTVELLTTASLASATKGEGLYKFILDRLTQRLFNP